VLIPTLLKQAVLPPGSLISLLLLGVFAQGRFRSAGRYVAGLAAATLFALSTPFAADALMRSVQVADTSDPQAQAIVILAAGISVSAPEHGGPNVDALTLERLRSGARAARRTSLPVLVSGGVLDDRAPAAAILMSNVLAGDYAIHARWIEAKSRTTAENALFSARILRAAGIKRVYLVTHAWHMARARLAFERQGIDVAAAGTDFRETPAIEVRDFLPSAKALSDSYYALHEIIGFALYSLVLS
jgi:uncharacterized SAM-binding protein YcdF (DUF218 family)